MPTQAIEPQRLYRQIGDQLRSLIKAGAFEAGSRLPAERTLAVQLGVSRPSLREALIALEVEGWIEVRMGSGIYVCEPNRDRDAGFDLEGEEAPLELIRARRLVEGEIAAAAARVGRKPQFDLIEEAIERMQRATNAGINPLEADRLFHIRVAQTTGNSVLIGLVARLFDARLGPLFSKLDGHFETPEVWTQAIAEHREVLKALRARDPSRARAAMRRHMDVSFKRLTSSLIRAQKRASRDRTKSSAKVRASPRRVVR
ncbi:MAG: FadR/GntR family transcriptional regulator [Burkholderiaceae bacterium]